MVVYLLDGWEYANLVKAQQIFDNLIAKGHNPSMCAVFIESLENRSEELTFNPRFLNFLVKELLSWVYDRYNVSKD